MFAFVITFLVFIIFGTILLISMRNGHSCGCGHKNSCNKCATKHKL